MKSFIEIGPHVFEKSGRQTHRQADTAALYRCVVTIDQKQLIGSDIWTVEQQYFGSP